MWRATAMAAVVLGSAMSARGADTPPSTAPRVEPAARTASPYWNGSTASDLPATDIRTVPVAHASYTRAQLTFNQSLFDLNNATRLVRMQLDRDPNYVKAVADEKAAYGEMEKARTAALAGLGEIPAYNGAETLHRNVSGQIADEHDKARPDPDRLTAMARLKLQYVRDNRKLEAAALDRDSAFQDARKKYLDAAGRVVEFRDAKNLVVAQDDALASLRKQVAMARIEKSVAGVFWNESIDARYRAVDYAEFYRGVDRYHGYGNGYSPYGYGGNGFGSYGFGTGY